MDWFGLIWIGLDWFDLDWFGLVWIDWDGGGLYFLSLVRFDSVLSCLTSLYGVIYVCKALKRVLSGLNCF